MWLGRPTRHPSSLIVDELCKTFECPAITYGDLSPGYVPIGPTSCRLLRSTLVIEKSRERVASLRHGTSAPLLICESDALLQGTEALDRRANQDVVKSVQYG